MHLLTNARLRPNNFEDTRASHPSRTSDRIAIHAEVELLAPHRGEGFLLNVSGGGLRAALDTVLEVGTDCFISTSTEDAGSTVDHVRVVWCRPSQDGAIVGFEFVTESVTAS